MAKPTDPSRVKTIRSGARAVYPWATWTDGQWWQLQQGADYTTQTAVFQATARNYARRNGFRLEVKLTEDGTLLRFTPAGS